MIKKHVTGNQYSLTRDGLWVRNFVPIVQPLDLNDLVGESDYSLFVENEAKNRKSSIPSFDSINMSFDRAVIVSDGYGFDQKHRILTEVPDKTAVIVVNRALVKWKEKRKIDLFLVNNPYQECVSLLPHHKYLPRALVSTRTNPEFVRIYKARGGNVLSYNPTPGPKYTSSIQTSLTLDDYRNPVCAAINLAYKLGVFKLLTMCCDDSFEGERPGATQMENGLWTYPQHLKAQGIMCKMFEWYKKINGIEIRDHSSGLFYDDAPYIKFEEIVNFLKS